MGQALAAPPPPPPSPAPRPTLVSRRDGRTGRPGSGDLIAGPPMRQDLRLAAPGAPGPAPSRIGRLHLNKKTNGKVGEIATLTLVDN